MTQEVGARIGGSALGEWPARRFALPRFLMSEHPFPWLFPMTAMLVMFGLYPLLYAIWLSLHKRNPMMRTETLNFTWNWVKLFADERVWGAIGHTYLYTGLACSIELVLGMLIALLLDTDRRGYGLLRALMTLPLVVPPAAARHDVSPHAGRIVWRAQPRTLCRPSLVAAIPDPGECEERPVRCAVDRCLAVDAVHGADHAGGTARAAEGAV